MGAKNKLDEDNNMFGKYCDIFPGILLNVFYLTKCIVACVTDNAFHIWLVRFVQKNKKINKSPRARKNP